VKAQKQQQLMPSGIPWLLPPQQQQQFAQQPGTQTQVSRQSFRANGTIDSVLFIPHNEWIATGNWSMMVDNGKVMSFLVSMIWNNGNGTSSHTHQIQNFRPSNTIANTAAITNNNGNNANNTNRIVTLQPDNTLVLKGLSDVGTNGRIVWKNVHTVFEMNKAKTINIAVDDKETNHHFAGQHVFGIVKSLDRCSDQPLPNMVVLPSCTS
jgi:hypothetical protein